MYPGFCDQILSLRLSSSQWPVPLGLRPHIKVAERYLQKNKPKNPNVNKYN